MDNQSSNLNEHEDFVNGVGRKLKSIIITDKISISKIAKDMEISRTSIHTILNGTGNPKVRLLVRIINYLGMSTEDFFWEL